MCLDLPASRNRCAGSISVYIRSLISQQVHEQAEQREEVQGAEHHRIVPVEGRFEAEQAEAVEREDDLDQQRRR